MQIANRRTLVWGGGCSKVGGSREWNMSTVYHRFQTFSFYEITIPSSSNNPFFHSLKMPHFMYFGEKRTWILPPFCMKRLKISALFLGWARPGGAECERLLLAALPEWRLVPPAPGRLWVRLSAGLSGQLLRTAGGSLCSAALPQWRGLPRSWQRRIYVFLPAWIHRRRLWGK